MHRNIHNKLISQESDNGDVIYYSYDANGNLVKETGIVGVASGSAISLDVFASSEIEIGLDNLKSVSGSVIDKETPASVKESAINLDESAVNMSELNKNTSTTVSGSAINSHFSTAVSGSAIDKTYYYDGFNRLIEYRQGDTIAQYKYNAEDYRVGKKVDDVYGVIDTIYFYEASKVLLEADALGNITAHNIYGTHLVSRTTLGGSYYYLYNAHGDVVMLIDVYSGEAAATYQYDAFGTVISQTGYADNSITYAGYQYDKESGLYYVNARYYNSTIGRFLTEDTYNGRMSDPLSLNRYTYCHNNPIRYTDPSGNAIFSLGFAKFVIGAVIGGGIEYISQKISNKKAKTNWKAVAYEAVIGGISSVIGGGIGSSAAKSTVKTVAKKTTKATTKSIVKKVAKGALKTGLSEAAAGFATDIGKQVIVDDKDINEIDLSQAVKTAAVSGISGAVGYAIGAGIQEIGSNLTSKAGNHLDEAVDVVDDIIDSADDSVVAVTNNLDTALSSNKGNVGADIAPPTKTPGNAISTDIPKNSSGSNKMDLQFFAEEGNDALKGGSQAGKDLYRAVSPEEFDDIISTNSFRGIEGKTLGAKEFGNSFDETLNFANKSINSDKAAIIKVTIPENIYNQLNHMNLDSSIFKSGTPVVEPEMLDIFNRNIISIQHVY